MSRAVTKIEPRHYRVDFGILKRESKSLFGRFFADRERFELDPYLITLAVRAVMRLCDTRGVHGRPLVGNEYRIFLSSQDYQHLLPVASRLQAGLDTKIRETLAELKAETIGDPVVRILMDDESDVPLANADILVSYVENKSLAAPADGEVTVRVSSGPRAPAADEATHPVREPASDGSLCLVWDTHEVPIAPRSKILAGRPHANPPASFVPLVGASQRINSCQLAIENAPDGVVITRLANANPVQVAGRLVQPGGKLSVPELPVEISLSSGELILQLKACGA